MKAPPVIILKGTVHTTTEDAMLFSRTGRKPDAVWLPRSVIVAGKSPDTFPGAAELTVRKWFAAARGLLTAPENQEPML